MELKFFGFVLLAISINPAYIREFSHSIEADTGETSETSLNEIVNVSQELDDDSKSFIPKTYLVHNTSSSKGKNVPESSHFLSHLVPNSQGENNPMDEGVKQRFREGMAIFESHRKVLNFFYVSLRTELYKQEDSSHQIEILEESGRDILALAQWKIHSLIKGEIANLKIIRLLYPETEFNLHYPLLPEIYQSIANKLLQNNCISIVERVMHIIPDSYFVDYLRSEIDLTLAIAACSYVLKIIDFLSKNEFMNRETLNTIYKKEKAVKVLLLHTSLQFRNELSREFWTEYESAYLIHHWYWPRIYESFQAPNQLQQKMIVYLSLIESIKYQLGFLPDDMEDKKELKNIFDKFSIEKDCRLFKDYFALDNPISLNIEDHLHYEHIKGSSVSKDFIDKFEQILLSQVRILNSTHITNHDKVINGICQFIYFVQTEMIPGIMEHTLARMFISYTFLDEYFQLQMLVYQFHNLSLMAEDYIYHTPEDKFDPTIYQGYLKKVDAVWDEFTQKYDEILNQNPHSLVKQLPGYNSIKQLIKIGTVVLRILQHKNFEFNFPV